MRTPPQRGRGWRIRIALLAIALVGATSAAAVWHEEHADDTDCAVCQLRHQAAVTLPGSFQFEPADISELRARTPRTGEVASGHARLLPSRAPPA